MINIAFFGTSDKSLPILEKLKASKENGFNLDFCLTKKDTLIGRKQEPHETVVKKWSKDNNVAFMEVETLKDIGTQTQLIQTLHQKEIKYCIVADFGFMIPKNVINSYKGLLINIHFSTLPKYRGASPVQHAIINGDSKIGITFQNLGLTMDSGDIYYQKEYDILGHETTEDLYKRLFVEVSDLVVNVLRGISTGDLKPIKQNEDLASYTYSNFNPKSTYIFKEDAQITWTEKPEVIERKIRAYNPWPIAWTTVEDFEKSGVIRKLGLEFKTSIEKNKKIKVYKANLINEKLIPVEIQMEGKNITNWESFLNGYLTKI